MSAQTYAEPWGTFLKRVLATAEDALTDDGHPLGRVHLASGEVSWDDCCDGQLYLRVISIFPARASLDLDPVQSCPSMLAARFGLGVIRCAATVNDYGVAPTPEVLTNETLRIMQDASTLLGVLSCEMKHLENYGKHLKHIIGEWTPRGPEGGCAGGEWEFTLGYVGCGC